ncbi:MAG: helix-turn-helix domain-containing protein [Acholeplasmataceae bacterium]|jgi:AraC-like DNA-binding protein
MNYEKELNFLCDVLSKSYIRASFLSSLDTIDTLSDSCLNSIIGINTNQEKTVEDIIENIKDVTKYRITNELKLKYICLKLPFKNEKNLLFIGPFLLKELTINEILEIGEIIGVVPKAQKLLNEYYSSIPIIGENDRILIMIDTFCELIWETSSFSIKEINKNFFLSTSALDITAYDQNFDETLANVKMVEMRYAFENELIQAVRLGQYHKEKLFTSLFNEEMFLKKRLQDPIRNGKNYCIIANTLHRKAAEQGGVHPVYVDQISSRFAKKIELITDIKAIPKIIKEMFSSYSRLVYRHSKKRYSSNVMKTILIIESDISADLSLNKLAEKQGITPGYLATIFKKETGKTVLEYIKDKRITHAVYLLNTTNLQIQTIAMHCGIMDVQYFSKIFKKETGKTPNEYRKSVHSKQQITL